MEDKWTSQLFFLVKVCKLCPSPRIAQLPSLGAVNVRLGPYDDQYSDLMIETYSSRDIVMCFKFNSSVLKTASWGDVVVDGFRKHWAEQ